MVRPIKIVLKADPDPTSTRTTDFAPWCPVSYERLSEAVIMIDPCPSRTEPHPPSRMDDGS